jgi:signal transduction histidine kinase
MILRAAERMSELIRDLLDAARIESGRLPIEPAEHRVTSLLSDAVEGIALIATEKSLRIEKEISRADLVVPCDRARVLQVFSNLLGNALKFTPAGGTVTVAAEMRGADAVFRVRDTGRGIGEDHLPHIFDRYWQAQREKRAGVGLGLFIAKGIVEAHGGTMQVESKLGEGTVFEFTVPNARLGEVAAPDDDDDRPVSKRGRSGMGALGSS